MPNKLYPIIITLCCLALMGAGCVAQDERADEITKTPLKGVNLSPRSFNNEDFVAFFDKAAQAGEIITWAGDWGELGEENGSGAHVVAGLAKQYNYEPVIMAGHFDQSNKNFFRPLDQARQDYIESAAAFAKKHKPRFIGFGVEMNVLYEYSPKDYDEFVDLFNHTYDAVKQASPNTQIFTVFQLERLRGLQGGLFGGINDPENLSSWQLLDTVEKADFIAFTTYPGLIYNDPADIPDDYYNEIKKHTSKPIAFTEIGWFRDGYPGWESDANEQAEFIDKFFQLTKALDPVLYIWPFLYDMDIQEPFNTMGLLRVDEKTSPAWEAWVSSE